MKKFFISSASFTGDIEVVYDADGRLAWFNVMNTNLSPEQVKGFKDKLPVCVDDIGSCFKEGITIMPGEIDFTADDIIREYGYKRNTHLVYPIVAKMGQTDRVLAYLAAIEYRKYCEREKKWYKPKILASWLKDKEYLNDWKKM